MATVFTGSQIHSFLLFGELQPEIDSPIRKVEICPFIRVERTGTDEVNQIACTELLVRVDTINARDIGQTMSRAAGSLWSPLIRARQDCRLCLLKQRQRRFLQSRVQRGSCVGW